MRAIALAIAASGVLLLLLCIANQPNAVSLYQPRYAPSNFRQGPRQFSPYNFPYETGAPEGPENNLPPVYSPQDVAQATVWTGYNYPQPVFASYSNTPAAAAPVPLAPAIFPRRRRIQISSRHDGREYIGIPAKTRAFSGDLQRMCIFVVRATPHLDTLRCVVRRPQRRLTSAGRRLQAANYRQT